MAASHPTGSGGLQDAQAPSKEWELPLHMGLRVRPPSAGQGKAKPSRAQEQTPPACQGARDPPPSPLISACLLTAERGQCA